MLDLRFDRFPDLATARCRLRRIRHDDAPALFALRSDPAVMAYVDREPFASMEEASAMINRIEDSYAAADGLSWALTLDGGEMIGMVGIWRIDKENHRGEIGYSLLPAHWNRGYISEAMAAVVDHGFEGLGLHSLEANVNPENAGSIRILGKLGFRKEAHFRENYFFRGRFLDSIIYSLLRSDRLASLAGGRG